ncbi:prosaposin [Chelonus insularis]|uniref:prosaposin n=1 Tax=Chelonus insularis TaxID=460826 RepID=UPI00158A7FED|nr:prosaposin [Chelonus insularis]
MKAILLAFCATLAITNAYVIIDQLPKKSIHLLGTEKCTWGPGYWCDNIPNSAECNKTKYCIKKHWENMKVPEDHDSVCKICMDMVQQARDQLESNQTQQDLKAVFDGSCKLMLIKPIIKECQKLAEEFIPQLVETLASQMNPSVVCSVSGLCNSAKIDQLLLEYEQSLEKADKKIIIPLKNDEIEPNECTKCRSIATHMENKFQSLSRDQFVKNILKVCQQMGSFSDACSNIILVNFDAIYEHLQENFRAKNICHLSGQCSGLFHQHDEVDQGPKVEIRPMSSVGMVEVNDDLPCKLCEQLVGHLRDLLVANTTEREFQQVLEGLCKQTKSFASECMSIVDQYYPEIYEYLIKGLNSKATCEMAGICPMPGTKQFEGPIMPLVPVSSHEIGVRILKENEKHDINVAITKKYPKTEADEMQLPIKLMYDSDSILDMPNMDPHGQKKCEFCEYILHYLQNIITIPSTENELKNIFGKVCTKLPDSIGGMCKEFLDQYGDALIALLVQEIDPSTICPLLHVCPSDQMMVAWEQLPKDKMIETELKDKPSCPLCLLAVEQIENVIKQNTTEANIEHELDKLCLHLPKSLNEQCVDFVKAYSKELIEMLILDLSPQEICVFLKLCDEKKKIMPDNFPQDKDGEIMTNEIPDFPIKSQKPVKEDTKCVICETVMGYIEKQMKNKSTKEEIESIIHTVCNDLPGAKLKNKCNHFVDQYGEFVIQMLSDDITPREICTVLDLCQENMQQFMESVDKCALCEAILSYIDKELSDPKLDKKIEDITANICDMIPAAKRNKCVMLMEIYEQSIINLVTSHEYTSKICSRIGLCTNASFFAMDPKFSHKKHMISNRY